MVSYLTMSRLRKKYRQRQIATRRKRKTKLGKLRQVYGLAKTKEKKDEVLKKLAKLAPWLSEKEFLASLKSASALEKKK